MFSINTLLIMFWSGKFSKAKNWWVVSTQTLKNHFLALILQDDKLSYDEVLAQFDVLVDSPITDYGHAVHEELWSQPAVYYDHCTMHYNLCSCYSIIATAIKFISIMVS